jgi:flagellar biosynthesis GTPase FlhF
MTNNINTPTTSNSCSLFNVESLDREDEYEDFSVYDNDDEYVSFEDFLKSVEGLESLESKERERQRIKHEEDERERQRIKNEEDERERQRIKHEEDERERQRIKHEEDERERQRIKHEEDEREYHQLRLESSERFLREQQRLRNEELAPIMKKFYNNAIENAIRMEQTGPTSEHIDSELFECHSITPFLDNPYRIETYEQHMALLKFHRCFHNYSEKKQQCLKEEHKFLMYYYNDLE